MSSGDVFTIRYIPASDEVQGLREATEAAQAASSGISPKGDREAAAAVEGRLRETFPRARIWVLREGGVFRWVVEAEADGTRDRPLGNRPARLFELKSESVDPNGPHRVEAFGAVAKRAWPQVGSSVSGLGARWTVIGIEGARDVPLHVPHFVGSSEDLVLFYLQEEASAP